MQDPHAQTQGIDHLGLAVGNLDLSRRFFVECLGWEVVGGIPDYPAVFVSDGSTRLTLWQVDRSDGFAAFDRRKNIGLHHVALKIADLEALENVYARVSAWPGVKIEFAPQAVHGGPRMHCMVYEPGGIRVEFVCTPAN